MSASGSSGPVPAPGVPRAAPPAGPAMPTSRGARTGRARARDILGNGPLVVGLLIVLALLLLVLFGPLLAPENPYLAGQRAVRMEGGQVIAPPFPPGPGNPLGTDPWGRDILSLLLYGARNTLVACLFIATARVIVGWTLGALAGWHEGRLIDRLIVSAIDLTTALPMLLTGVLLILAFDIHRGLVAFMAALCLVGWGEIAQYIRAEFMVVRRQPFIEGARVIGLDGLGIAIRHVLPNVLPALTVLALLEMGAVLMILGELGFVGIFVGGGTAVEDSTLRMVAIPDIPEWGAMMADSRFWARSQPWMVFWPALCFFVSVLGFNLLGEGLRRLIQRGGINTGFVFSRQMLLALAAIVLSTAYIITHVGPAPSYARLAQQFDREQARAHLQALTGPTMAGRALGTAGASAACEYIAARYREYGLQYINQRERYFQEVPLRLVVPVEQPELALLAPGGSEARRFAYRVDFGPDILRHGGSGVAEAPLAFVDFTATGLAGRDFKGLDLRGRVVMYDPATAPPDFDVEALIRGAQGLLLIDGDVHPRLQLADEQMDYLRLPTIPVFRITPAAADVLLTPVQQSLGQLAAGLRAAPPAAHWRLTDLPVRVRLALRLSPVQEIVARNVVGIWPGSDVTLDEELVIVSTHYDAEGQDPGGTLYAGANVNASGVAVMLDILRLWHEQGFKPRRTVLFAAWAGGSLERGGAWRYADSLQVSPYRPVAALHLYGLGRGARALAISEDDNQLHDLLVRSAAELGCEVVADRGTYPPYRAALRSRCPAVVVSWQDAGRVAPAADDLAGIDLDKLGRAGQIVNLALITLSREASY